TYAGLGDYPRAMDYFRWNLASLEGELLREHFGMTSVASVLSCSWLVSCLAEVGTFAEGLTLGEEGIRVAEAVNEPESLIIAYRGVGGLYLYKGDCHRAIPMLERGLSICQVANLPGQFPNVATPLGAAYTLAGRVAEALPLLEQVVQQTTLRRRQGVARL